MSQVDDREKQDFLRQTFHVVQKNTIMNLSLFLINFCFGGYFFGWDTAQNLDHVETVFYALHVFN